MPSAFRKLLELIRFSHTLFALPFAFLAAALAWADEGLFRWQDLIGILLCMVFARSAAMAFNRLVDRHIDARNPRTATRHSRPGRSRPPWCGSSCSSVVLRLSPPRCSSTSANRRTRGRSISRATVLLFVLGYSLAKRFTSLAHLLARARALALAPVAAWIAVRGLADMTVPLLLGAAVAFWVCGFDILYACQDVDFDRKEGLHSIPARFGVRTSLRIAAVCHAVMFALLVGLYFASPHLGTIFLWAWRPWVVYWFTNTVSSVRTT